MNHAEFIQRHVEETLLKEGFSKDKAQQGGIEAVGYYRRSSKPSSKRRNIFDDCLDYARMIVRYGRKNKTRSLKGQLF